MNNDERLDALMLAVLAITIALVGSRLARALSIATFTGFGTADAMVWYFRLRVFEIETYVLALGGLAYVLPRTRLTAVGGRAAAALGVVGIATQVGQWLLERSPRVVVAGGGISDGIGHVAEMVAYGAVIAMWFVREHRDASAKVGAPDLA